MIDVSAEGTNLICRNSYHRRDELTSLGMRYQSTRDYWVTPNLRATRLALTSLGVVGDIPAPEARPAPVLAPATTTFYERLYPYQKDAVDFLVTNPFQSSLLALSPGLGKTAVAVVGAQAIGATRVLILVAKKVLLPVWCDEAPRWGGPEVTRVTTQPSGEGWCVTNMEQFIAHVDAYASVAWDLVIVDESIVLKNRHSKRFKAMQRLRRHTSWLWLLSGGPAMRFVDDLWAQYHMLVPQSFTSYWRFAREYCVVEKNVWAGEVVVRNRTVNMADLFNDIQFTRHRDDVLPDLPEERYQTIHIELTGAQAQRYRAARDEFLLLLDTDELDITSRVAQLTRLQQIVSHPANIDRLYTGPSEKTTALLDLFALGALACPCVVWTHWKETNNRLFHDLKDRGMRVGQVTGDTPNQHEVIQSYKDGAIDVLLLGLGVGRYGLTLTNTRTVVNYDRTFDGDATYQASFRVRRIGLTHSPLVITLHAPGTTDDLIVANLAGKMSSISGTTNADLARLLGGFA